MATLAKVAERQPSDDVREEALRACLQDLPDSACELLSDRYSGESVAEIAQRTNRSPAAVSMALYRLRKQLQQDIESRLGGSRSSR